MFPFLSFFSFSSLFSFAFLPSLLPFLIPHYPPLLPLFAHSFLLLPPAPFVQIPLLSYFIILSLHFPSPFSISFHPSLFLTFLSFFSFSSLFSFAFLPYFLPFLVPPYLPSLPLFARSSLLLPSAPSVQIPLLSYFIILSLHFPSHFSISFHPSLFLNFVSFFSFSFIFSLPSSLPYPTLSSFASFIRSFLCPFTFRTFCSDSSISDSDSLFYNFISSLSLPFFHIVLSFSFPYFPLFLPLSSPPISCSFDPLPLFPPSFHLFSSFRVCYPTQSS